MKLTLYLNALRRSWWLVCLTTFAALAAALIPVYLTPPAYRSTAKFIVTPAANLQANRELLDSLNPNNLHTMVSTFTEILGADKFFKQAGSQLQLNDQDLSAFHRTTAILPDSSVVQFSIEGTDPQRVAALANGVGQAAIGSANGIYRIYEFQFLDRATAPPTPLPSPLIRNILLALTLGIASGVLLIILREQLDPHPETAEGRVTKARGSLYERSSSKKV